MSSAHDEMTSTPPRRSKRKAVAISPIKSSAPMPTVSATPTRKRANKKVRFSTNDLPSTTIPVSTDTTGLTPAVSRAGLATPKRRVSTPARLGYIPSSSPTSEYDFLQFTPLRQALDERCKRRIRRNGLSEENNKYDSEKREQTHLRHEIVRMGAELKKLREELDHAKQNQGSTQEKVSQTEDAQSRVDEVEAELSALRRSFGVDTAQEEVNWDNVPRIGGGPRSDGGDTIQIYEDDTDPYVSEHQPTSSMPAEDKEDAVVMSLELASARQAKQSMLGSFSRNSRSFEASDLHFADSPSRPKSNTASGADVTPRTFAQDVQKQLRRAESRADDAQLALSALEGEVRALGFFNAINGSASGSLTVLADHFRSIRLELERLMPGETEISFNNPALFPELVKKLKQLTSHLASRDAELKSLCSQEKTLRGNFDHAIVAAEKAQGKINDLEKSIEESAEEMLHVRMRSQKLERDLKQRDDDCGKLATALDKYRGEVNRLEGLISQVEEEHKTAMTEVQASSRKWQETADDSEAKAAAETTGRRKAEESAVARLARIQELEVALSKAKEDAEATTEQLQNMQERESRLAQDVGSLNSRISSLSTALTSANAEVDKLRIVNQKLGDRYRNEVEQGLVTVGNIKHHLLKAATRIVEEGKGHNHRSRASLANWELESDDYPVGEDGMPLTPASTVRFADPEDEDGDEGEKSDSVPRSVETGRGKKRMPLTPSVILAAMGKRRGRRRYDSGVGMSPLGDESEGEFDDSGIATPDLSSELGGDVDVDMEVEV